jgi:hypothetical protein
MGTEGDEMEAQLHTLSGGLTQASGLLHKYAHHGQGTVVDQIVATLETRNPDYKRLASIDMWGGSGAVWEVCLTSGGGSDEEQADEKSFREAIVRIATAMDQMKIGTQRSRFIAETLQGWIDRGL